MCREIFKGIAEKQIEGLMFHSDMADYYAFLNLKIFQDFHNRQYIEESENFRKIKDYFIEKNHKTLLLNPLIPPKTITPIEWEDKTTMDVDKDSIKVLLKKSLETYHNWEHEVCKFYKESADKLFDNGYYEDYCFMRCLIDDIEKEKNHIESLMADLSVVDYDITKVKGLQYKV